MSHAHLCERLAHDTSWAAAAVLENMVAPLLREEERREFFAQAYRSVRAAIESYVIFKTREEMRINPSAN